MAVWRWAHRQIDLNQEPFDDRILSFVLRLTSRLQCKQPQML